MLWHGLRGGVVDPALVLFGLLALGWGIGSMALAPRGGRPIPARRWFPFLSVQLAAGVTGLGLVGAWGVAVALEARDQRWHDETLDYIDAFLEMPDGVPVNGPGGALRPNLDFESKAERVGRTVPLRTDNFGFRRDGETSLEKPPGTFRILLLGDSFVAGYRVANRDLFHQVLERQLNEDLTFPAGFERVEILGANADTPWGLWYYLETHAEAFQPDLVVLAVCQDNDFSQAIFVRGGPHENPRPIWRTGETGVPEPIPGELKALAGDLGVPVPGEYSLTYPDWAFRGGVDPATVRAPGAVEVKPARTALGRRLQAILVGLRPYPGHSFGAMPGDPVFARGDSAMMLRDRLPFPQEVAYAVFAHCLDGIADWSDRTGVPVAMVALPMRFQAIPQDHRATFEDGMLDASAFDFDRPTRFLEEQAGRVGMPFLDLRPAFAAHGEASYRLFMPMGDIHWNVAGHRVVAGAMQAPLAGWIARAGGSE